MLHVNSVSWLCNIGSFKPQQTTLFKQQRNVEHLKSYIIPCLLLLCFGCQCLKGGKVPNHLLNNPIHSYWTKCWHECCRKVLFWQAMFIYKVGSRRLVSCLPRSSDLSIEKKLITILPPKVKDHLSYLNRWEQVFVLLNLIVLSYFTACEYGDKFLNCRRSGCWDPGYARDCCSTCGLAPPPVIRPVDPVTTRTPPTFRPPTSRPQTSRPQTNRPPVRPSSRPVILNTPLEHLALYYKLTYSTTEGKYI